MEPITMAAAAAAIFATKVAEETGVQTGKGLSAAASRLVAWLRRKGNDDSETGAALTMVTANPNDHARVELLGRVLANRATADPDLAQELDDLVEQAQQAGDVRTTIGGAHIHGNVTGGNVVQVGGNQYHFGTDPR